MSIVNRSGIRSFPSGLTTAELVLAIALAVVGTYVLLLWLGLFQSAPTTFRSTGPTVTQLESIAELVPLRVYVADILEAEGEGYRGSWLIKGDAVISVSLKGAKVIDRDDQRQTAVIAVPPPRVLQARVDHERTKTWDVRKNTWIPFAGNPDLLRDSAMLHAQKLVEETAREEKNLNYARETAALVLKSMYRLNGWEVEVQWLDRTSSK